MFGPNLPLLLVVVCKLELVSKAKETCVAIDISSVILWNEELGISMGTRELDSARKPKSAQEP